MKIVEYKITSYKEVQPLIDEGWQPFGSPLMGGSDGVRQAMVKYENKKAVFSPPYPIIEPGKVLGDYHTERLIQAEIDKRLKSYQKYWNPGANMFEFDKGTPEEQEYTDSELCDVVEKAVRMEMGK